MRTKAQFICSKCDAIHNKWAGRCDICDEWNSIIELDGEIGIGTRPKAKQLRGTKIALTSLCGEIETLPRIVTKINELDRVTGGGFVPGSAILLGGDPGIGKSTLLTQACAALSNKNYNVVYVSGEEAIAQIKLRSKRLNILQSDVKLAAETNVENILATLQKCENLDVVVIDSIQTLWSDLADSSPGTVTQVRTSVQEMIRFAKNSSTTVILVGHVTKEGQIAGPRVVEHMVDAVLYFEGDKSHHYRILRTIKNRFGPTDEIGVFEMSYDGLNEVQNPSELFLNYRSENAPGSAVFAGMEGTRPLLVEVQTLVSQSSLGMPRRSVVGWDTNRLSMVLAVLSSYCNLKLNNHDIYISIAGGYKTTEPALDLAAAAALISAISGVPLPADHIYFGEVSLSGTIRPASLSAHRIKEAQKLGFKHAIISQNTKDLPLLENFSYTKYRDLAELVAAIASEKTDKA
ncbi:DNA repair protein RadA [Bartonella sp. TP]|uniref:DNA repair protein RadA n=1 Tax=Bartonella sp. TP TaxID=3057550 RepID=UPI0025B1C377|nr:DNA repair protein RadA [Bartonella sp. TP]MDN5249169.1 DNA repair protein RadA [Alphaproteobacteria bacterium]WJW80130.1 DNA repair protein RadA [Bartonella sp. TP]